MLAALFTLALIAQGIPLPPSQSGTVSGTLKTEAGRPAAGVRVAAMAQPESPADISYSSALASIAETDAEGHFRLDNIPPGRYLISAGRVDYPTYFPGTQDSTAGCIIVVRAGGDVSGIDFAMNPVATRPPDIGGFGGSIVTIPSFSLPVRITVEGEKRFPIFSAAGYAMLRFTRSTDGQSSSVALSETGVSLTAPAGGIAAEYSVALENIPDGYVVKSIVYNGADITQGTLKVPAAAMIPSMLLAQAGNITGFRVAVLIPLTSGGGAIAVPMPANSNTPLQGPALEVTLSKPSADVSLAAGVRVAGKAKNSERRSIYISGVPGMLFSDGSFEFRGVLPGHYTISTPDNPLSSQPLAASIIVGNVDMEGVELTETLVLPANILTPVSPVAAGNVVSGAVLPLVALRGRVVDQATQQPVGAGTAFLTGHYGSSYQLDADGQFEFTHLLPGDYVMEIHPFDHADIRRTIVVGEKDILLELAAPRGEGLVQ